jgi:cytidylate kinase
MATPTSVVCISHTAGAGAAEVAPLVAERLGFRLVDEGIVAAAAARENLSVEDVASVESRRPLVARILREFARGGGSEIAGLVATDAFGSDLDERHRQLIREVVHETAAEGNVVIVSHAASIGLAGRDGLLRVLVTASDRTRARRLSGVDWDPREGERAVKREDEARADYLKRFYDVGRELPTHYDVVVNTDGLGPDEAAAVIVAAARP